MMPPSPATPRARSTPGARQTLTESSAVIRILHLSSVYAPFAVGGAERVVEILAQGSVRQGAEVAVAHIAPAPAPAHCAKGVHVHPLRHRNPLWIEDVAGYPGVIRNLNKIATLFNVCTAQDFKRVLRDTRPDVVHSHSMVELTPMMWQVAKSYGVPIVHTLHDYDLLCIRAAMFKNSRHCTRRHLACAAFSQVKRRYHRHIDHVAGVSRAVLDRHLDYGLFAHVPETRRHVVWNPVPRPEAPPPPRPRRAGTPHTFGFMGRLVAEKGIHTLLDACVQLAPGNWRLQIAGRAPGDDDPLSGRIRDMPIELLGYVDPHAFLENIDTLVVPSIWLEPFGLTTVEAYAHGVAVIGSNVGGVAEIISSADATSLVEPGDAAGLAAKMQQRIEADVRAGEAAGYESVLERTDPEFVVQQYLQIYADALAAPR